MAVKTGYMVGPTYYSDSMPKGEGDRIKYSPRLYGLANLIYYNTEEAPSDSVVALQDEFLKIGYLDPHNPQSDDERIGPMTRGAAWRYLQNFYTESIWENLTKDIREIFGY